MVNKALQDGANILAPRFPRLPRKKRELYKLSPLKLAERCAPSMVPVIQMLMSLALEKQKESSDGGRDSSSV